MFVLAGLRKDGDKAGVYALAHKLVQWGIPRLGSAVPSSPTTSQSKGSRKSSR